ncbi:TPA: hypothetical protein PW070_002052, partial [Mannheimia haemolytica]|nr:hypothetical protein [Mannheimia haemolytica]
MFSFIKKLFDNKPSSIQNIEEPPKEIESELTSYDETIKTLFEKFLVNYSIPERHNYNVRKRVSKEIIFSQLLESDSFSMPEDKRDRLYNALVISESVDYQELHAIFLLDDFKWRLFDNCREFCEENKIYPYAYQFLANKPAIPDNLESALLFVKVSQLRELLKDKLSQKIPTRKDEVYPLFAQHFTLEEMKEILEERFIEVKNQFENTVKNHKINILGQWFTYYSNNLSDYYLYRILDRTLTHPKLDVPEF